MEDWSPPQNLRELLAEVLPVLVLVAAMWLGMLMEGPDLYNVQPRAEVR